MKKGVYYENLLIDKSLTIVGDDVKNTIIIGTGNVERGQRAVITITANGTKITGFTIKSQNYSKSSYYATGISIETDNCTITKNNISNNFYGIFCSVQSFITISKNNISHNHKDGIRFCGGSYNKISNNTITENAKGGIAIEGYSNTIAQNTITNNNRGIGLGSSYSLISGNKIGKNQEFNFFFAGSENIITKNNIFDSKWGIYFSPYFAAPTENTFFYNNFQSNENHIGGVTSYNIQYWDKGFPLGGNYWDDYLIKQPEAKEVDNSGIGDKYYEIYTNNTDKNPLLAPINILEDNSISVASHPNLETNSIVTSWCFDEVKTNGITPDETGLSFAVLSTSSEDISCTPILVDGKYGKALSFDGAAYVNTPILPHLEIPKEITIDVWINFQEFKNLKYNNILVECVRTRAQLPDRTFGLAVNGKKPNEISDIPQGALLAYVYTEKEGLNEIATTESVIKLNQWIHVVFTRSLSSGMHIYVDGEEKDISVVSGKQNPKGSIKRETELYIGHDAVCIIDEMKIYNTEVKPISNQLLTIESSFWINTILTILIIATFFYYKFRHKNHSK